MDLSTKIEFVLSCHLKPSSKIGLITLIVADKPLTVVEINNYNNFHKTFENYTKLFKEEIESGLVTVQKMKDANGYTRQHFCIENDILEDLISNL